MSEHQPAAFLRSLVDAGSTWSLRELTGHLLDGDPLQLAARAGTALLECGVILPARVARRAIAERIAHAVVRREPIPFEAIEEYLASLALDAVDGLRVNGIDPIEATEREAFLERLASCLGLDRAYAVAAYAALHSLEPERSRAVLIWTPPNWLGIEGLALLRTPELGAVAAAAIRTIVRTVVP